MKKGTRREVTTIITTKEDPSREDRREAVITAGTNRMPGSILLASPGGKCPRTAMSKPLINITQIEDLRPTWTPGCKEEDNRRYRELLQYMEDKRIEAREMLKQEKDRKKEAKQEEDSWKLLRTSTQFLTEKDWVWKQRRIEELERIREEEKKDRLSVVREKK